jgi:rhodanese-related sulfurtransferase
MPKNRCRKPVEGGLNGGLTALGDPCRMRHNRNKLGAPEPSETTTAMEDKLRFHTAVWDLSVDLKAGLAAIVVIAARCRDASIALHIPGAVSFPHRKMNSETTARLDRGKVYIVYCDGIGCNASTKGAYKGARLGFRTKELPGGLDLKAPRWSSG